MPEPVRSFEGRHRVHVLIAAALAELRVAEGPVVAGEPRGLRVLVDGGAQAVPLLERVVRRLRVHVSAAARREGDGSAVVVDRQAARVVRNLAFAPPRHLRPVNQVRALVEAVALRRAVGPHEPGAVEEDGVGHVAAALRSFFQTGREGQQGLLAALT